MDAAAALNLLTVHTQATVDPVLSAAELGVLLDDMAGVDAEGRAPSETGWVPTYERAALPSVVVLGWEMKAAKAAPEVTYAADGAQFSNSDVYAHCLAQADRWRRRVIVSIPAAVPLARRVEL